MQHGIEYIKELVGAGYLTDTAGIPSITFNVENISRTPEDKLVLIDTATLPEGKRTFLDGISWRTGKRLSDFLIIRGYCPVHKEYEVFRPNEVGAVYDNIFCPYCIDEEVVRVDMERHVRNQEVKRRLKELQKEAKSKRRTA